MVQVEIDAQLEALVGQSLEEGCSLAVVNDERGTYTGSLKGNDKHGVGVFMYHSGEEYFGCWRYNCRHGIGTMLFSSHADPHSTSTPSRGSGPQSLFSSPLLSHSSSAELQWRSGSFAAEANPPPDGDDVAKEKGVGARYRGEWKFDEMCGFGTMFYGNGCQYVGEFAHNQRTGSGVFTGANGDRYEGEWLADQKHGFGRIFFSSRDGSANGTATGSGFPAGISKLKMVEGSWEHDSCCGSGKAELTDGECGAVCQFHTWKDSTE